MSPVSDTFIFCLTVTLGVVAVFQCLLLIQIFLLLSRVFEGHVETVTFDIKPAPDGSKTSNIPETVS